MYKDDCIREMRREEHPVLEQLLYQAIYQPEGVERLPYDVIQRPELRVYIEDWGQPDDMCLLAERDGEVLGGAWTRILPGGPEGTPPGYGNIDPHTPEYSIAIFPQHRGQGIGRALMERSIQALRERGYSQVSLSVNKENRARRLYERLGFELLREEEDLIMVLPLQRGEH